MTQQEIQIPQTEKLPVSSLKADGKNPNRMTKEQHERLATSIKKYGFIVPIITNKDLLIADGEQRWTVAKSLGMDSVSVIRLPVEEVDRRLLRQVLNKLRGEHELLLDAEEFEAIIDLGAKDDLKYLLGLNDNQLTSYLNELHPPTEEDTEVPDVETIHTEIQTGDKIQLGTHILMCGDSSKDSDQLLNSKADLLLTDPPYGIKIVEKDGHYTKQNIAKSNAYMPIINDDKPFNPEYLLTKAKTIMIFGANYFANKLPLSPAWFIWDKNDGKEWDFSFADSELIYTNLKIHSKIYRCLWRGMCKEGENGKRQHPTQKPVKLLAQLINEYSLPEQTVLDLYGGSGSTLIACEQTGRTCYMMEIDPRYCEIIAQRWEKYTGQKRQLVKSGENNIGI